MSSSKLKVEFVDNSASQYDSNGSQVHWPGEAKNGAKLFLGDYYAASYLQLKARDCKSVINCSSEIRSLSREQGIKYLNVDPAEDEKNDRFDDCAAFITAEMSKGKNVLVHCENGTGKSAAVVLYFIMKTAKVSLAESFRVLQRSKSDIKPYPSLVKLLIKAEKKLNGYVTVRVDGRTTVFTDGEVPGLNNFGKKGKNNNDNKGTSGYVVLVIVIAFFGLLYGVLVALTGKA